MRRMGFMVCAVFLIFVVFLSVRVFHRAQEQREKLNAMQREIQTIDTEIVKKRALPDGRIDTLNHNVRLFHEVIRFIGEQSGLKQGFKIDLAPKNKGWEGIHQAIVLLNFYDLEDAQGVIKILRSLEELSLSIPMYMVRIEQHGQGVGAQVLIYGL